MKNTSNRSVFAQPLRATAWASLCTASLLSLAGCGGGGSDSGTAAPATATPNLTNAVQAKTLAARTAGALFAATDVANAGQLSGAALLNTLTGGFGTRTLGCATGTGSYNLADTDSSGNLSTNDSASFALANCQPYAGSPWRVTGSPRVSLTGGANLGGLSLSLDGVRAEVAFTTNGSLQFAPTYSISGSWNTTLTLSLLGGLSQSTSIPTLSLTLGGGTATFTNVGFGGSRSSITGLTGQVSTSVVGVGLVNGSLSQLSPLTLPTTTGTRFVPHAGTVRITTDSFYLDVTFAANGVVTLSVDNGKNGSVDLTITTSVTELDGLLGG
jgi:hypothetical protein